jgi:hypothetical protein
MLSAFQNHLNPATLFCHDWEGLYFFLNLFALRS